MVAGPLDDRHLEQRRIGHLQEKDPVAGDVGNACRIVAQRQCVEAVEDQAQVGVIGLLHDGPGLPVQVDMAPPGQRLVADLQPAACRALGQFPKLCGAAGRIVEGLRRGVGTAQHQRATQCLHHVELAFGALQAALEQRLRHALEVPEGLVEIDAQAQVVGALAQFPRAAGEVQEVVLEELDAVEAGGRDGLQLLLQRSAEGNGGNGFTHGGCSLAEECGPGLRPGGGPVHAWACDRFRGRSGPRSKPPRKPPA